jgi:hypothetical protein
LFSINGIFSNLISSLDNKFYNLLDDLVFVRCDIFTSSNLFPLLGNSSSPGIIFVCNAFIYGFLLYYGISLLLSHLTFSQVQTPSQFIFKLLLCTIFLNSSPILCYSSIYLTSAIALTIRNIGENILGTEICFCKLIENLNSITFFDTSSFNLFSFDGIVKSLISVGFINLGISYACRYVMIKVFILICPFAILCLSIDKFSWIFKSWIKTYISLLFLEILVSFILVISFSLDLSSTDSFSKLVYAGSIYSLIKANSYMRDFMGGISTESSLNLSSLKSLFNGGK